MRQYVAKRVLLFVPTLFALSVLVFALLRIMPGDPALLLLAGPTGGGSFDQEEVDRLRHKLGTDRPLIVQYGTWLRDSARGDLGTSFRYGTPVGEQLKDRLPLTLQLTVMAIIISFIVAVPLGIISALNQDTILDYIGRTISFTGIGIPIFVTGLVTVYLLVRIFTWLPPLGYVPPWEDLTTNLEQLIFPALALGFFNMAFIARVTRSSMLEILREDYIRTARSKGLHELRVTLVHCFQNASLPILTVTAWSFGVLLGGAVVIEQIFVLPGMGTLLLDGVENRDYPVIQAEVMVVTGMVLLLNLITDLIYGWVDPRIRFQ